MCTSQCIVCSDFTSADKAWRMRLWCAVFYTIHLHPAIFSLNWLKCEWNSPHLAWYIILYVCHHCGCIYTPFCYQTLSWRLAPYGNFCRNQHTRGTYTTNSSLIRLRFRGHGGKAAQKCTGQKLCLQMSGENKGGQTSLGEEQKQMGQMYSYICDE